MITWWKVALVAAPALGFLLGLIWSIAHIPGMDFLALIIIAGTLGATTGWTIYVLFREWFTRR